MKHKRLAAAAALTLNLLMTGAASAVPLQFFVQGYLKDKSGNPLTGAQQMEFKVYQGGSQSQAGSGAMTYDETATVTTEQSGVFNYLVGTGNHTTPALSTATFDAANAPVYLEMSAGGNTLLPRMLLTASPYAAIAGTAENLKPTSDVNTQTLEAGSGTIQVLTAPGGIYTSSAVFTASGNGQFAIVASTGINVISGGVTAPFFNGTFYGDGSKLFGVGAANVSAGNVTAGTLGAGVLLPTSQLIGAPINPSLLPASVPTLTSSNTWSGAQAINGSVSAQTATLSGGPASQYSLATSSGINVAAGGVSAPYFNGTFYGSGAGLSGVTASNIAAANVTPGTLGAGVLLPASQLSGGPISSSMLPATVANTASSNTWNAQQTVAAEFDVAPAGAAIAKIGGTYSGPTSGYSGIGQETSRHTLAFRSWSNVANDTLGTKLISVNKTAYPSAPWYFGQTSELHVSLLTHGALTSDDTSDLFQFTPSGFNAAGAVTAGSGAFTGQVSAANANLTAVGNGQYSLATSSGINVAAGGVTAPFFNGTFYGSGAGLSGVSASNVAAGSVLPGTLASGVLLPTSQLSGSPIATSLLPATVPYTSTTNTFGAPQNFAATGNALYSLATSSGISVAAGGVTAPYFNGTFYGNGAALSGVTASNVAAGSITPGTIGAGVQVPVGNLTNGPVPPVMLPTTLAYTNAQNTFVGPQIINGGVTASSANLTAAGNSQYSLATSSGISVAAGGVTAPYFNGTFYGNGAALSGVTASNVGAANITPGTVGAGVLLLTNQLTGSPIATSLLPATLPYTSSPNTFQSAQTFAGGISGTSASFTGNLSASSAALTAAGNAQYSLTTSSGISVAAGGVTAPYFNGTFYGNGAALSGVTASNVAASNITPGTLAGGVQVPTSNLASGALPSGVSVPTSNLSGAPIAPGLLPGTVAYTSSSNTFTANQTVAAQLLVGPANTGAYERVGGIYSGPTTGYNGQGQETSRHQIVMPSWSNVANDTLGVKLIGVNKTAYPSSPWYLSQFSEFHLALLTRGALTPDDTTDLFQFTPSGLSMSGNLVASAANFGSGITASSAALTATGNSQYSLATSSGINVAAGGVTAPFFNGTFYGNGAALSGVTASNVSASNVNPGTFNPGVVLPAANVGAGTLGNTVAVPTSDLVGGPIASSLLPTSVAFTSGPNTFQGAQTFAAAVSAASVNSAGSISGSSASLTATGNSQFSLATSSGINVAAGGVNAPYFNGVHYGNGAALTGVTAANVSAANVTPGQLVPGVQMQTTQLVGAPLPANLLPSTAAYTTNANTWMGNQTVAAQLLVEPANTGAFQRLGGIYSGPTSGYSGQGQETSRHQLVMPSWSNVANDTLGVKLIGINKTAYPSSPWYLSQNSEFHIALLTHGALTGDDTADLFQFTPTGFNATGAVTAASINATGAIAASSANLTAAGNSQFSLATSSGINVAAGGVNAPYFNGTFYGNGAALSGVTASNVSAANVTPGTLGAGVVLPAANVGAGTLGNTVAVPTANLAGGPISSSLLPASVAYTSTPNTFQGTQTFPAGISAASVSASGAVSATSATLTAAGNAQYSLATSSGINVSAGGVNAPFFNGAHYGSGAALTGVTAANVAAGNVTPGQLVPGVQLQTTQLVGQPLPASLLPSTAAYTTNANTWLGNQTVAAELLVEPANAGALARIGGVYSGPTSGYSGQGQETSRHQIVMPSWSNVANDTLGVKLIGINKTAYPGAPWYLSQNSEFHIALLTHGALTGDDTLDLFQFTPSGLSIAGSLVATAGNFSGGITASSAALTAVGSSQYSLTTSSGISVAGGGVTAPYFNGTFYGNGAALSGVTAANVAAGNVLAGTLANGVQVPVANLQSGTLPSGIQVPTASLTGGPINASLLPSNVALSGVNNNFSVSQTIAGGLTATTGNLTGYGNGQYSLATSSGIQVQAGGVTAPYLAGSHYGSGVGLYQLPTTGLVGPPIAPALLPSTAAYTTNANTFGPTQTFNGGVNAANATITSGVNAATMTLTATGNSQYSLQTSSGIQVQSGGVSAPFLAGTHYGSGAGLTNLPASSLVGGPIAQSLLPTTMYLGNGLKSNPLLKPNTNSPLTKVDFTADILSVQGVAITNVSVTANTGLTGVANGLDAGSLTGGNMYAVFVITNDQATQVASLLSLSAVPMALPSGYTRYRRVGWINVNASGNIVQFTSIGDWIYYTDATQITKTASNGNVSFSDCVPPTSRLVSWAQSGGYYYGGMFSFTPTGSAMPATYVGGAFTNEDGSIGGAASGQLILNSSQQVYLGTNYSARALTILAYYDPI